MRTIEEVNREIEQTQRVIKTTGDHLHRLQEQKAKYGIAVPPHVDIGIQEAQTGLETYQANLQALKQEQAFLTAPVVAIANLGPIEPPPGAIVVDRSDEFVFAPRQVPPPERWQTALLPELFELPDKVARTGLIRLQGSSTLSTAFAFGYVFRHVGGYHLAVEQRAGGDTVVWHSTAEPPPGEIPLSFVSRISGINAAGQDGLVIVYAVPQTSLAAMVGEVGLYWGEERSFRQTATDSAAQFIPQRARGILTLEAGPASQGEYLADWQVASLAATSRRKLIDFIEQVEPEQLHLFMAGPVGLCAFMGHHWNQIGLDIQCYERLDRNQYAPSVRLKATG